MDKLNSYPYADGDLIDKPNHYFYSAFAGWPFLIAWIANRDMALAGVHPEPPPPPAASSQMCPPRHETAPMLDKLMAQLSDGRTFPNESKGLLDRLVQRFEISKRVYRAYDEGMRPAPASDYRELGLYIRFADVLVTAFTRGGNVTYLNCLLKVVDTLVAMRDRLSASQCRRLAWLILEERAAIYKVAERKRLPLPC